jgi:hypothetical protein
MSEPLRAEPRRLCDIDQWELYELSPAGGATIVVSIRPLSEYGQVEYELWDDIAAAPSKRGSIASDDAGSAWATAPRADLLQRIVDDATMPR